MFLQAERRMGMVKMRWKVLLVSLALLLYFGQAIVLANDGYDPACDPAQRGPEAVKIASLKACPASTTWGYDLPYTYAYGVGNPYYVGHNYGAPSGAIYENPATYPYGVSEPGVIYGDPENGMLMNYGYSFPYRGQTYLLRSGPMCDNMFPPFAFTG